MHNLLYPFNSISVVIVSAHFLIIGSDDYTLQRKRFSRFERVHHFNAGALKVCSFSLFHIFHHPYYLCFSVNGVDLISKYTGFVSYSKVKGSPSIMRKTRIFV